MSRPQRPGQDDNRSRRASSTQRSAERNRSILIIGTVVAALLVAVALFTLRPGSGASQASVKTFDLSGAPTLGQASAPVQLVVFEDFKCPNCKRFDEQELPTIQSRYIDTGKAKLSRLPFPFLAAQAGLPTDDSELAAEASLCAWDQNPELYWPYSTILFRAQGSESEVWATKDRLTDLASNVDGLDTAKLRACLDSGAATARVQAGFQQGRNQGVNATPSVFVNGVLVQDYSAATVGAAIDQALK